MKEQSDHRTDAFSVYKKDSKTGGRHGGLGAAGWTKPLDKRRRCQPMEGEGRPRRGPPDSSSFRPRWGQLRSSPGTANRLTFLSRWLTNWQKKGDFKNILCQNDLFTPFGTLLPYKRVHHGNADAWQCAGDAKHRRPGSLAYGQRGRDTHSKQSNKQLINSYAS